VTAAPRLNRWQASTSFFEEKEAKKTFLCWGMGVVAVSAHAPDSKKVFSPGAPGRFFQKAASS
jgi:hypothetical protein